MTGTGNDYIETGMGIECSAHRDIASRAVHDLGSMVTGKLSSMSLHGF